MSSGHSLYAWRCAHSGPAKWLRVPVQRRRMNSMTQSKLERETSKEPRLESSSPPPHGKLSPLALVHVTYVMTCVKANRASAALHPATLVLQPSGHHASFFAAATPALAPVSGRASLVTASHPCAGKENHLVAAGWPERELERSAALPARAPGARSWQPPQGRRQAGAGQVPGDPGHVCSTMQDPRAYA